MHALPVLGLSHCPYRGRHASCSGSFICQALRSLRMMSLITYTRRFASLSLLSVLLVGCAVLPERVEHVPEPAFDRPMDTTLGRLAARAAQAHPDQSGFVVLDTGRQAFIQRAALIEAAERSIDAQYYIWNSDISGRYLARRLLLAADRGVRVRILLDDINVAGRDPLLATLDRHDRIDIRIFNPSAKRDGPGKWLAFLGDFQRLNRRMHNKTFVVDGAFGIVGGRNIGDEYFDLHAQMNFRDRDVLATGPIVRHMSSNFDAYWNSSWSYPVARLAPPVADDTVTVERARSQADDTTGLIHVPTQSATEAQALAKQTLSDAAWAQAELVFDAPAEEMEERTDTPKQTALALRAQILQSRSEILIESAYLILGDVQLDALAEIRNRGVRVAAITNSLASNDLTTNHAGYARRRPAMLARGMALYELRPDAAACMLWIDAPDYCAFGQISLHAKSAVFDRTTLYIGSLNFNLRSIYLNGETALIIHSPVLAERVARDMEIAMAPENSWRLTTQDDGDLRWSSRAGEDAVHEPATGWWKRFKSGFFALFPLEKYL
jgi:putative cardiolipin synthase